MQVSFALVQVLVDDVELRLYFRDPVVVFHAYAVVVDYNSVVFGRARLEYF